MDIAQAALLQAGDSHQEAAGRVLAEGVPQQGRVLGGKGSGQCTAPLGTEGRRQLQGMVVVLLVLGMVVVPGPAQAPCLALNIQNNHQLSTYMYNSE